MTGFPYHVIYSGGEYRGASIFHGHGREARRIAHWEDVTEAEMQLERLRIWWEAANVTTTLTLYDEQREA